MVAQNFFGFVLVLLAHHLRTVSSEPQFSDSNGFVKLPTQLQQKVYKYSQGYQGKTSIFEQKIMEAKKCICYIQF